MGAYDGVGILLKIVRIGSYLDHGVEDGVGIARSVREAEVLCENINRCWALAL